MMHVLFSTIVGVLCALAAGLGAGGLAWVVLDFCGVGKRDYGALKLGMLVFGLPAGLAGLWYGYVLGATMVPDDMRAEVTASSLVAADL